MCEKPLTATPSGHFFKEAGESFFEEVSPTLGGRGGFYFKGHSSPPSEQMQGGKEGFWKHSLSPAPSGRLLLKPFGEIQ